MSVMFDKSLLLDIGRYQEIMYREDYATWAKCIHAGARCLNVNAPLMLASGGTEMAARRGGVKHLLPELRLQILLHKLGFVSLISATTNLITKWFFYLMSTKLRFAVYSRILRKKPIVAKN